MFRYMTDVVLWGVVVAAIACLIGIAAEGRFQHFLKVLVGMAPRKEALHLYDSVPRPDVNWDIVGAIANPEEDLEVSSVEFNDVTDQHATALAEPTSAVTDPASARHRNPLTDAARQAAARAARGPVREMPPTVTPRRRQPVTPRS